MRHGLWPRCRRHLRPPAPRRASHRAEGPLDATDTPRSEDSHGGGEVSQVLNDPVSARPVPGLPSRLSPPFPAPLRNGTGQHWWRGERGAAGALPGAAAGWRVPGPVPPAGRPQVAATAVERRPHEEQPGATRQPVSVPLLRRRRACRLREPQLAESLAGSATGRCSSRSAIWIVVLFEHTAVTAGARVESQVPSRTEWEGPTAQRRCAPTSVPLRRNPCSTSPECVFRDCPVRC